MLETHFKFGFRNESRVVGDGLRIESESKGIAPKEQYRQGRSCTVIITSIRLNDLRLDLIKVLNSIKKIASFIIGFTDVM